MLLSLLRLKASGFRRRHIAFALIARLLRRSLRNVQRFLIILPLFMGLFFVATESDREESFVYKVRLLVSEKTLKVFYGFQTPFLYVQNYLKAQSSLVQRVQDLENKNRELEVFKFQAQSYQEENEKLKNLLNMNPKDDGRVMTTVRVLGTPTDHEGTTLVIAVEPGISLQKDQVVMASQGVVGRILKVGRRTARVLMITDSRSRIPARVRSTGEQVILGGDQGQQLKVVHWAEASLPDRVKPKIGDILVTSGYGGIYPPDLPVACVSEVGENTFKAVALVDSRHLDYVMVFKAVIPVENEPDF